MATNDDNYELAAVRAADWAATPGRYQLALQHLQRVPAGRGLPDRGREDRCQFVNRRLKPASLSKEDSPKNHLRRLPPPKEAQMANRLEMALSQSILA